MGLVWNKGPGPAGKEPGLAGKGLGPVSGMARGCDKVLEGHRAWLHPHT